MRRTSRACNAPAAGAARCSRVTARSRARVLALCHRRSHNDSRRSAPKCRSDCRRPRTSPNICSGGCMHGDTRFSSSTTGRQRSTILACRRGSGSLLFSARRSIRANTDLFHGFEVLGATAAHAARKVRDVARMRPGQYIHRNARLANQRWRRKPNRRRIDAQMPFLQLGNAG